MKFIAIHCTRSFLETARTESKDCSMGTDYMIYPRYDHILGAAPFGFLPTTSAPTNSHTVVVSSSSRFVSVTLVNTRKTYERIIREKIISDVCADAAPFELESKTATKSRRYTTYSQGRRPYAERAQLRPDPQGIGAASLFRLVCWALCKPQSRPFRA